MEARGSALLIAAGAGSGKTKVLTERLMRYILDEKAPQSITKFVVITFTQDSAEELRSRISDELSAAAASAGENGNTALAVHLRRQQALCAKAMIGTIHHFCASILRENGHLLGLPSDFKIISSERAEAMKATALDRVLSQRYEQMPAHPGFEELVNSVGTGRDDSRLAELVLQLYEKMRCHARPEVWAEERVAELRSAHADVSATEWGKEILKSARAYAGYWSEELDRLLALMQTDEIVWKAYGDAILQGAEGVRELQRALAAGWEEARECTVTPFGRFKAVKKEYAPELTELVKARRDACKADMEKIRKMLYADSASLSAEMAETAPAMEALLNLTLDFEKEYAAAKRKESLADYSDLEHFAVALLTDEKGSPTPVARSIAARYAEIMVDEYQDVSRVQEAVFQAVSRGGDNLFMVGDVKQAIYRFRLADPEIFNEKYRVYPLYPAPPGEEKGNKILLRENFRSRREILAAANSVFTSCMSRQLGDIDYDDDTSLLCGAVGYEGTVPPPEITLFAKPETEKDKTAFEAEQVAEKISALIAAGTPVTDGAQQRCAEYGDIAILLRNANSNGGVYRKALEKRGIPVSSGQGGGLFETREVTFLLALLRIMDNPHMDIPLITVLSSPVFGFSPDELAEIRTYNYDSDFYDALKGSACTNKKAEQFLALLTSFRDAAPNLTAEKLIRMLLMKTDILAVCSAMKDGKSRIANLMQMIGIAGTFEADGYHGLHRFVQYLTRLEKKNSALTAAGTESSAVRILSIHRSKGLEFPIVFLCDTAHRFNTQDTEETVLVHPTLGLGPKRTDSIRRIQLPTLARKAIALRLNREMLSEEMRLLYVAMTRPKERLFITAVMSAPEAFIAKQKLLLPLAGGKPAAESLALAHSYIEWLTVAALADGGKTLHLQSAGAIAGGELSSAPVTGEAAAPSEEELADFARKLEFVYPYASSCTLPSKLTATELKHYETREDDDATEMIPLSRGRHSFRSPDFSRKDKALTGSERGIATHLALQYMDIAKAFSPEGISSEIARLKEQRYLSQRQADAVSQQAIEKLFASSLGERIRHADAVHREFRFSILCSAKELLQADSADEILLQGVVDCCLEEEGELVIIDYKTDRVFTEAQVQERCALYAGQVKAYAMALARIFEKHVKETVLYFLSCDRMVSLQG